MRKLFLILLLALTTVISPAQDLSAFLPSEPPKDAKENAKLLFTGIALQAAGIGLSAASVYLYLEVPDDEYEVAYTGITFGLGIAVTGTALIIGSTHNIVTARRSMHEIKKAQKNKNISLNIEPTRYGVGLVCRF